MDTRLKKLETENLDAIILAAAGLKRMGFEDRITEYLDENLMLPAVGQGALCIESRTDDPEMAPVMAVLNHPETRTVVLGERAFLNRLEGGCQVPIAAHGFLDGDEFHVSGLVAALDGETVFKESLSGPAKDSEQLGVALAEKLLAKGGQEILDTLKDIHETSNR